MYMAYQQASCAPCNTVVTDNCIHSQEGETTQTKLVGQVFALHVFNCSLAVLTQLSLCLLLHFLEV